MLKYFPAIGFYFSGDISLCDFFQHAIFSIGVAELIDIVKQKASGDQYNTQANEGVYTYDIHHCEKYQQPDQSASEIPDVLCF